MKIKIADISLAFDFPAENGGFLRQAEKRYDGFRLQGRGKPDFLFSVKFKKLKKEPFRPSVTRDGNFLRISRGDFFCEAGLKKRTASLTLNPSVQSFDSFLRVFISTLLPDRNGLLVHAAGIFYGNRTFLLAGKSGSGKSTVSRLSAKKAFILSDELVPVKINKASAVIFSSPFWGEMRGRGRAFRKGLDGVYLLKKAGVNFKTRTSEAEFLPAFLRCVMNFSKDPAVSEKAVKIASALWRLLRPEKLYFSKAGTNFLKLL